MTHAQTLRTAWATHAETYRTMPNRKNINGVSDKRFYMLGMVLNRVADYLAQHTHLDSIPLAQALLTALRDTTTTTTDGTRWTYAVALTSFLEAFGILSHDDTRRIRGVFDAHYTPYSEYTITSEHIERALRFIDRKKTDPDFARNDFSYLRDAALIATLSACGARIQQMLDVPYRAVVLREDALVFPLRTQKKARNFEYEVGVPYEYKVGTYEVQSVLLDYHARRTRMANELPNSAEQSYFCTAAGESISSRYIQIRLQKLAMQCGLTCDFNPHAFRHFAAERIVSKHGLHAARKVLAHSSTRTTERYTRLSTTANETLQFIL